MTQKDFNLFFFFFWQTQATVLKHELLNMSTRCQPHLGSFTEEPDCVPRTNMKNISDNLCFCFMAHLKKKNLNLTSTKTWRWNSPVSKFKVTTCTYSHVSHRKSIFLFFIRERLHSSCQVRHNLKVCSCRKLQLQTTRAVDPDPTTTTTIIIIILTILRYNIIITTLLLIII